MDYGYPEEFVTKDTQEWIIRAALIYVGEKTFGQSSYALM